MSVPVAAVLLWLWRIQDTQIVRLGDLIVHSYYGDVEVRYRWFDLSIPFSIGLLITGLAPLAWYLLHCRDQRVWRRRMSAGLCPRCGYDLHATPKVIGPKLEKCP